MSEYRLEMRGVCKSFPGVKALDHAQLCLHPGKVHALMGENGAGKSTLMKCMFGIYTMDEGEILFNGEKVTIHDPMEALKMGIAMVHQELQPIPARTIGENIFLGRYPIKKVLGLIPTVDHKKMYEDTAALLKRVRMDFDPKAQLGSLSVSQMQSVEIAKAVSANCKVLILDEPTAALNDEESALLLELMRKFRQEGISCIFITHKLHEIKVLVTPTWKIEGAVAKVEACNNGFDAVPTWEDITAMVQINRVYNFTNKTKTASKWGVNIRFTITKNEGFEGEVSISGFGGAYE